jgi:hypothetical protein
MEFLLKREVQLRKKKICMGAQVKKNIPMAAQFERKTQRLPVLDHRKKKR